MFIFLSMLLLLWLYIDKDGACKSRSNGAICPICLQRAYISQKKIYKYTIFRSIRLNHDDVGLYYSNKSDSDLSEITANLYQEIIGQKCKHDFKSLGGGGGNWGFFHRNVHRDYGSGYIKRLYGQRVTAIEALYVAYLKTKNKELAQKTYAMIDSAFPMDEDKLEMAKDLIYNGNFNKELSDEEKTKLIRIMKYGEQTEDSEYFAEIFWMARKILEYEIFIPRLKHIQNEQEWIELLSDIEQSDKFD